MPGRIEQTAERAHQLVETGEVVAARAVLREALAAVELDAAHASPSLATAAMLYARVLVTLGEPGTARRWAAYAHTASRRLYGAGDERTLQAASVLAGALYRAGAYSRSAHLYRELISQLSAVDGPAAVQVLAAQADLATVLHARGDCAQARGLLEQTWRGYRHRYGDDHPLGLKMLARLGVMERGCGRIDQARDRFALAEALCRRHLPPGHRLTAQIGILSRTPPDRRHTCNEPLALEGDREGLAPVGAWPPGTEPPRSTTAVVAPRPAVTPPFDDAESDRADSGRGSAGPDHRLGEPDPGREATGPGRDWREPPWAAARADDAADPRDRGRRRLRLAVVAGLAAVIVTVVVVAAGGLIARAGSTSDGQPAAQAPAPAAVPAAPSTFAGTGAPSDTAGTAPPSTAGATPPASLPSAPPITRPAAAPGPPTAVRLTDTRTAITLAWAYPQGATGSVVLSAGRPGQPRRTFQTLPAGTTHFTVYGLAAGTDFCFGVGVAYPAGTVKTAPAVCTHR